MGQGARSGQASQFLSLFVSGQDNGSLGVPGAHARHAYPNRFRIVIYGTLRACE
jgi:hypothetical protein